MTGEIRITEVARRLGVTAHYLRMLEGEGRVPTVPYDRTGRLYTEGDVELLRSMGIGQRPRRLKAPGAR